MATPNVHALTAEAEHLLTLRETHRLTGIPAVAVRPGRLASRRLLPSRWLSFNRFDRRPRGLARPLDPGLMRDAWRASARPALTAGCSGARAGRRWPHVIKF